jgi:DNA-binding GntR family transcriptional regulator
VQSGNATLVPVLEALAAPLFAFIAVYRNTARPSLAQSVHLHDPIVLAMRSKKPQAIHAAMREHFEGSYNEFLDSSWEDFRSLLASRGVAPPAAEASRTRAGQAVSWRGARGT